MTSERQTDSAIRLYDERASSYDESHHSAFTKRFVSYVPISDGQQVLDLACGTGLLSFLEADAVGSSGSVTGIDITPGMLAEARSKKAKAKEQYSHVNFYQHDILDLGKVGVLQGKDFDVITVASALVLFPDPVAAVQHWVQYLKPGGVIVLDATHPRDLIIGTTIERTGLKLGRYVPYHREWSQSEDTLRVVLEAAGLNVEKVVTMDKPVGYGRRYYNVAEADEIFERQLPIRYAEVSRQLTEPSVKQRAKAVFKEEWEKFAVDGKIEEIDAVFLGIARKPKL